MDAPSLVKLLAPRVWRLAHGRTLELGPQARIMGILNTTPDSFSDGGAYLDADAALQQAMTMVAAGADIIDVGGESTRPGAEPVSGEQERERVVPIIKALAQRSEVLISVDTYRAETAEAAVLAGAHIVNDVWGCQREPGIAQVAARHGAGLVVMNNRRERTVLPDLVDDALAFWERSLEIASDANVANDAVLLDPGYGFADGPVNDLPLLNGVDRLHTADYPLLVGTSRKRFLGAITGRDAADRDVATSATSVVARCKGAAVFRVHDVATNRDALAVADALLRDQMDTAGA
ncbi:MAG: dihydropteroate synthase [Pseudomonadota bacterium]